MHASLIFLTFQAHEIKIRIALSFSQGYQFLQADHLAAGTEPAWDQLGPVPHLAFNFFFMVILKNCMLFIIYEKCPN